jgi:hypothetical protein
MTAPTAKGAKTAILATAILILAMPARGGPPTVAEIKGFKPGLRTAVVYLNNVRAENIVPMIHRTISGCGYVGSMPHNVLVYSNHHTKLQAVIDAVSEYDASEGTATIELEGFDLPELSRLCQATHYEDDTPPVTFSFEIVHARPQMVAITLDAMLGRNGSVEWSEGDIVAITDTPTRVEIAASLIDLLDVERP